MARIGLVHLSVKLFVLKETQLMNRSATTPEDDRRRGRRMRLGKVTEDHIAILMNWPHQNPRRTYKKMAAITCSRKFSTLTLTNIRCVKKKEKDQR